MKRNLSALAALVASLLLLPLLGEQISTDALAAPIARPAPQQLDPVSLDKSLDPLVRYFNEGKEKPRLLVLLSPT